MPCRREIFQAGPSRDKSTSIWLSLVARPSVIYTEKSNHVQQKVIIMLITLKLGHILYWIRSLSLFATSFGHLLKYNKRL